MKTLILIFALMVAASAHLCLLTPHQRGTMDDLNTAGATDCGLVDPPPCGGRNKSMKGESIIFHPDSNVSIVFQKNLDHFNAATPGAFIVNLCHEKDCTQLMKVADSADAKSGHLYTPTITIAPDTMVGAAYLQVNYMTSNPKAPANFYQCADVMIAKRPGV